MRSNIFQTMGKALLFSLFLAVMLSIAGYVERAEAEVSSIVSLADINGNGSPEVSVLMRDTVDKKNYVYVHDASSGDQLSIFWWDVLTPISQVVVPDLNNNNASEIAMLGVTYDAASVVDTVRVVVTDSSTGTLIKNIGFDKDFPPVAMAVLPDINGNEISEIAVLGVRASDGNVKVMIKDAFTGNWINVIFFGSSYPPVAMAVVPDINGNEISEVAVLGVRVSDDNVKVMIKDASTGDGVNGIDFDGNFPPVAMEVVPDINGNGFSEIAVLGVSSTNSVRVMIMDASSGDLVGGGGTPTDGKIFFDSTYSPVAMAVVLDVDGNGADEIAVLGVRSTDGAVKVMIKDASTGNGVNGIDFDGNYPPVGMAVMPDMNGNSKPEVAVLGVNPANNNRLRVIVQNASTAELISEFFVPGITLVSVGDSVDSGKSGNSYDPSISKDGRYVAFWSWASNLVAHDAGTDCLKVDENGVPVLDKNKQKIYVNCADVFVRDMDNGVTTRISVAPDGKQANHYSQRPSISGNGQYVAFMSYASNLVANGTNGQQHVFVRNTKTDKTKLVSRASSVDGDDEGNGISLYPGISLDGRYVAFHSRATNLDTLCGNKQMQVFVRDTKSNTTTCVSVNNSLGQGKWGWSYRPAISKNGKYVAFYSEATNLVANSLGAYECDTGTNTGDCNGAADVFLRDRSAKDSVDYTTTLVSVSWNKKGSAGNGRSYVNNWSNVSITPNGQYVAFISEASNMDPVNGDDTNGCTKWNPTDDSVLSNCANVFVRDTISNTTTRVSIPNDDDQLELGSQGNGHSTRPSISSDGRYVSFMSRATNLVAGDTNNYCDNNGDKVYDENCADIFVRDTITGETRRLSVSAIGAEANGNSYFSYMSANGRYVVFFSEATNLVAGDNNGKTDIFRVPNPLSTPPGP